MPCYHAREVARLRVRQTGARLVLGSATPSLETWWRCQPRPLFSMANGTIGFILIAAADIVQVSGRQEHIHVNPFDDANVFTQPVNPQGVIPFVAAPGTLEVFASQLFYGVKHGVSIQIR